MPDNRMLIVPAELAARIDENRGDMTRAQFLDFLIRHHLDEQPAEVHYVTQEQLDEVEHSMKELLRSFLDFFLAYDLELGPRQIDSRLEALTQKLQDLGPLQERSGKGEAHKG